MDQPHVLLVSSPGLGHLIPVLELGNRISSVLNVQVTILAVTSSGSSSLTETETVQAAKASETFKFMELRYVDKDHLVESDMEKMRAMKSTVRSVMKSMRQKPTVMIVDFFGAVLMSISHDVGVTARYVYVQSQAWYRDCMQSGLQMPTGDVLLVNTWEELHLQGNTLAALRDDINLNRVAKVPVYPIGPIIKSVNTNGLPEKANSIFEWLDKKRKRSVVFVCLGELSIVQIVELACGLELSGQSFLWVLSRPASYLSVRSNGDDQVSDDFLPKGFLDRTHGVGLVVTDWAPQVEILSHRSIGGLLSQCSWSWVLESLTKGVPIIAWPLNAQQRMNATFLKEVIGVAIGTSELPSDKVIVRQEVAYLVQKILAKAGERWNKMRAKAEEVKVSSELAWYPGGSSHSSFLKWARQCCLA